MPHPRVTLIQALATHIRQLCALPDEIRERTFLAYRQLCDSCGCHDECELIEYLAKEKKPRLCPIARLLRACGQMKTPCVLPSELSQQVRTREVSWHRLLKHLHSKCDADESARADLCVVDQAWTKVRKRLRGRGIRFPSQLVLVPHAGQPVWLLPEQMRGNPEWLEPL